MNKCVRNITKRIAPAIFLFIIGLLIFNKAFYTHSHVKEDGTIVVHAHPYNKSGDTEPFKHHRHSNADLLWINGLDLLLNIAIFSLAIFVTVAFGLCIAKQFPLKVPEHFLSIKGRAPPIS